MTEYTESQLLSVYLSGVGTGAGTGAGTALANLGTPATVAQEAAMGLALHLRAEIRRDPAVRATILESLADVTDPTRAAALGKWSTITVPGESS